MTTAAGAETPEPPKGADADAIERDIAATRDELGQTVDALTAKLDVKSQAQAKVQGAREQAAQAPATGRRKVQEQPQAAAGAGVAVLSTVLAVVGLVVWRKRTRASRAPMGAARTKKHPRR